jgi:hypothetical protein
MFQTEILEKVQTYILCSMTFFVHRAVYEIMLKKYRKCQAADDNMAHAHCMLDTLKIHTQVM